MLVFDLPTPRADHIARLNPFLIILFLYKILVDINKWQQVKPVDTA